MGLAAGCAAPQKPAAPEAAAPAFPAPAAPATKAAIGSWGVDLAGLDRSVKPGDDFFRFAGGGWLKTTQIPADRPRFGAFDTLSRPRLQPGGSISLRQSPFTLGLSPFPGVMTVPLGLSPSGRTCLPLSPSGRAWRTTRAGAPPSFLRTPLLNAAT
jgi:hypothetical protein